MRETWTLYSPPAPGGYELTQGWVRDVDTRDGLYTTPPKAGSNGDAGQGHGELWSPKPFGPGGFVQQVWLMSDLTRAEVDAAYDELLRVATWPYDLVRVVRGMADGSERECGAELVVAIEPTNIGQVGMKAALEWSVPAGFWQDTTDVAAMASANVANGSLLSFPALAGGTAPMDTLLLGVHGPMFGPVRLTQPLTGQAVQINAALTSGQTVTLDCETGEITGIDAQMVAYTGATFMEMPPLPADVPLQLQFNAGIVGTGTTGASQVSLTGRRRWLA